jgi:hypothetical protein
LNFSVRSYGELYVLVYNALQFVESRQKFRRNMSPPSSGLKISEAGSKRSLKVKLCLCIIKNHIIKEYWGVQLWLHLLVASAADGNEWSASGPDSVTPGTNWREPDPVWTPWRREKYFTCRDPNPDSSVVHLVNV